MSEQATQGGATESGRVLIWDLPLRIFHWALVGLIAFSYATAELGVASMQWHIYSGFAILTLLAFRILWGFVGPRSARFARFVRPPSEILAYVRDLLRGREKRYLGHNPLGALSTLAFLLVIGFQVSTGLFADDDIFTQGPLASLVSSDTGDTLTGLHRSNFNIIVALIALHLLAVAFHSFVRREGLIRAMFTGRKKSAGEAENTLTPGAGPQVRIALRGVAVLAASGAVAYAIIVLLPEALS